ncbi:hypothetical protein FM037_07375 [Shewanella psychropiezotolerans]|uniref:Bacteriocin n=1 Tax=Shewanella psychropiezotolerans TaxID=2593655 RepID=A0ABX5WVF9_9GAMM|nr:hypothetical protein [Shewanella psychropiezotolerans]QDO83080.1 hypothetical protein FM037_07375 [Shewanella psychropiezotolerans]
MKELIISEQELIFGGNGAASVVGSALASGIAGGSAGCAALGTAAGLAMGTSPMGVVAGATASAAVTKACNNRPSYTGNTPGPIRQPAGANRYWPGGGGGSPSDPFWNLNLL